MIKALVKIFWSKHKKTDAITYLRKVKVFYANESDIISEKVFKNKEERDAFFKAVFLSRTLVI